jgi:ferrochelatase
MQASYQKRIGLLISNLGSPHSAEVHDVKQYLKQFLNDPHVFDAPWIIRYPFVNGLILQTRTKKSAEAYQSIWTKEGSPLLSHTKALTQKLKSQLPFPVEFGMRYGEPSIQSAIERLTKQAVNHIIYLPLYPQYSFSATESTLKEFESQLSRFQGRITGKSIESFHDHPLFIKAVAEKIKTAAETFQPDAILLSYHGVPVKQLKKSRNKTNYRDQCLDTTRMLQEYLGYPKDKMVTAFQSRLGPTQWIEPHTEKELAEFPKKGFKRIIVVSPSFTTDCLETLEEIQIRYRDLFLKSGGEEFRYVPCVNSADSFVDAIKSIIEPFAAKPE